MPKAHTKLRRVRTERPAVAIRTSRDKTHLLLAEESPRRFARPTSLKAAPHEFTACHRGQIGGASAPASSRESQKPWQLNGRMLQFPRQTNEVDMTPPQERPKEKAQASALGPSRIPKQVLTYGYRVQPLRSHVMSEYVHTALREADVRAAAAPFAELPCKLS